MGVNVITYLIFYYSFKRLTKFNMLLFCIFNSLITAPESDVRYENKDESNDSYSAIPKRVTITFCKTTFIEYFVYI